MCSQARGLHMSPDRSNRADRSDLGDHQAKEKPEC